jgi:hypothetical protein
LLLKKPAGDVHPPNHQKLQGGFFYAKSRELYGNYRSQTRRFWVPTRRKISDTCYIFRANCTFLEGERIFRQEVRLAEAHPDWVLGFVDETWWSRLARPPLHTWSGAEGPLRLEAFPADKDDPDPKALCCYGLLRADTDAIWLRFVQGRPVSQVTEDFLAWLCERLAAEGRKALLLVWDNAAWHKSQRVCAWIRAHNQRVKRQGGVRIVVCALPTKSPWLNRIEPYWIHGKRAILEADRKLTAAETMERVCAYFGCEPFPPLTQQLN